MTDKTKQNRGELPQHVLVTVGECAAFLRMSYETVRIYFASGTIPGFKLGGEWRAWRTDVIALAKKKQQEREEWEEIE